MEALIQKFDDWHKKQTTTNEIAVAYLHKLMEIENEMKKRENKKKLDETNFSFVRKIIPLILEKEHTMIVEKEFFMKKENKDNAIAMNKVITKLKSQGRKEDEFWNKIAIKVEENKTDELKQAILDKYNEWVKAHEIIEKTGSARYNFKKSLEEYGYEGGRRRKSRKKRKRRKSRKKKKRKKSRKKRRSKRRR